MKVYVNRVSFLIATRNKSTALDLRQFIIDNNDMELIKTPQILHNQFIQDNLIKIAIKSFLVFINETYYHLRAF